jgi:hypothetical protein
MKIPVHGRPHANLARLIMLEVRGIHHAGMLAFPISGMSAFSTREDY